MKTVKFTAEVVSIGDADGTVSGTVDFSPNSDNIHVEIDETLFCLIEEKGGDEVKLTAEMEAALVREIAYQLGLDREYLIGDCSIGDFTFDDHGVVEPFVTQSVVAA